MIYSFPLIARFGFNLAIPRHSEEHARPREDCGVVDQEPRLRTNYGSAGVSRPLLLIDVLWDELSIKENRLR